MAFEISDWSFAVNGDIRYIGDLHGGASPSYSRVIELHRAMGDLLDNPSSTGDDLFDIVTPTTSNRSTDTILTLNAPYNFDDASIEYLFDGSITQDNGDTIYDGFANFGNAVWIEMLQNGALIPDSFWNNNGGLNPDVVRGISHRFLVKVRNGGVDIDGRRLRGMSREFGFGFSEFPVNGTERGNNVLALSQSADLNNATASGTVAAWNSVVNNNEGYTGLDIDNNGSNEFYFSNWDRGTRTINEFYERGKYLTRRGTGSTLYGLPGDVFRGITHEIDVDTATGTFVEPEALSWAAGTGQLLAIDSTTAGTKLWMQLLTGIAPTDGDTITGGTSSATVDVNVTVVERTIPANGTIFGQSTGSAIIGVYGLGIEPTDLTSDDTLFDLTNAVISPPNFVTFTVSGLVAGEDRVLVGPEAGGTIDFSQFSIGATLSGGAETSVDAGAPIPLDTPSSGTIRVFLDNGVTAEVQYSSYVGSTFTITSTDFSGVSATSGNDMFIGYIDELASGTTATFTSVFVSSRPIFVRVRDGAGTPIQTFETPSTLGSGGGSATVIRTSDA